MTGGDIVTDENTQEEQSQVQVPLAAVAFGYAGILPFVLCATVIWFVDFTVVSSLHTVILGFGIAVFSFMGGIRWGLSMFAPGGPTFTQVGISIVPAFLAWMLFLSSYAFPEGLSLMIGQTIALIVFFAALLFADFGLAEKGGVPAWYRGLRFQLTLFVEASLIAVLVKYFMS